MKYIHFESIDSTNTYLKQNYKNLENFTFVSASNQTQGKGRNKRTWEGNENNLLFSLLIKDPKYFDYINSISIISAYSIIQVLEEYKINNLSIKWPNDIFVENKKICGILLEATTQNNIECVIVGVGINVNQTEFNFEAIHEPTSLKNILGKNIDIDELKNKIYNTLIDNLNKLINGYDFYEDINKYDYLKNSEAYALIHNQKKLVKVRGINYDYSLSVIDGETELNINSGEISFHI